jgi:coniferyl-aldehyde dehydrogenase
VWPPPLVEEQTLRLKTILDAQRAAFLRDAPPTLSQRKDALGRLRRMLIDNQDEIAAVVDRDFGHRSRHETLLGETFVTVESIKHTLRHLNMTDCGQWWTMPAARAPA